MWIIDRYMLRQFLSTFVICSISLFGLYVVFDLFTNLEEFLRCGREHGGVLRLIASFYGYRTAAFFDQSAGLLALVAAMFTVTWIQRHNELTALMAAGVARTRVAAPVVGAAVLIAILAAGSREVLIPHFRDALSRRPQDLVGDVGQPMDSVHDNLTDILFRGECTYANEQRVSKPNLHLPRPSPLDRYGQNLVAENAYYRRAEGGHPAGYLLKGVTKPDGLASKESLCLEGKPVVITPRDAGGWLKADECFVVSGITFMQLAGGEDWQAHSSTPELIAGLRNPSLDYGADVRVAIHSRLVQPLLDVTLLFLGLPLVLRRENRNVFLAIGVCAALVSLFMVVTVVCRQLGTSYWVSPSLGAWLPLFIFVPPAFVLTESMHK
ncbi:MAG: LptF/LptG family permease [Thermoguttaceae bacterium]